MVNVKTIVGAATAAYSVLQVVERLLKQAEDVPAVTAFLKRALAAARLPDPLDATEAQLQLVEEAAAPLAADPAQAEVAADWQRRARALRAKVPLARGLAGRPRREAAKDLRARAEALLAEALQHGLPPWSPTPRPPGRWAPGPTVPARGSDCRGAGARIDPPGEVA